MVEFFANKKSDVRYPTHVYYGDATALATWAKKYHQGVVGVLVYDDGNASILDHDHRPLLLLEIGDHVLYDNDPHFFAITNEQYSNLYYTSHDEE